MGFEKKTWLKRIVQYPGRRVLGSTGIESVYDVSRQEGTVTQQGDKLSVENMNNLESRIESAFGEIKSAAFQDVADNLTTTDDGYVLDARQGKGLADRVKFLEDLLANVPIVLKKTLASNLSAKPGDTIAMPPEAANYDVFLIVLSTPVSSMMAMRNGAIVRGQASYTTGTTQYTYNAQITGANTNSWIYSTGTSLQHQSGSGHSTITADVVTISSIIGLM